MNQKRRLPQSLKGADNRDPLVSIFAFLGVVLLMSALAVGGWYFYVAKSFAPSDTMLSGTEKMTPPPKLMEVQPALTSASDIAALTETTDHQAEEMLVVSAPSHQSVLGDIFRAQEGQMPPEMLPQKIDTQTVEAPPVLAKSLIQPKKIAIILDTYQATPKLIQQLGQLRAPITLAIAAHHPDRAALLEAAEAAHLPVVIDLPMEPLNPKISPGPNAFTRSLSPQDIDALLTDHLEKIPGSLGVKNHMGSAFTSDAKQMRFFMQGLKERGLFFVDSRTGKSAGEDVAKSLNLPYMKRHLFLDPVKKVTSILGQLNALTKLGDRKTYGIGMADLSPTTISALRKWLDKSKYNQSTVIVPIQKLAQS